MLLFGSNPVISAPAAEHVSERIASLDLLVTCDFVMSETAAMADVVFPVTQWAEETGTMTNLEGRVLLRNRAVSPPDGVRSDLDVLAGLAERLGHRLETDPVKVFDELRRASKGGPADYSGITYERITEEKACSGPALDRSPRARPARSWTPSPPRTAAPGSCRSSTGRWPRRSTRTIPST